MRSFEAGNDMRGSNRTGSIRGTSGQPGVPAASAAPGR